MNNEPRPKLPPTWPHDSRSRVNLIDGVAILVHPDRRPHQVVNGRWEEVVPVSQARQVEGAVA